MAHDRGSSTEMLCSMQPEYRADASPYAGDSRLALSNWPLFQQVPTIRPSACVPRNTGLKQLFRRLTLIVTPTTGILAPHSGEK